MPGGIWQRQKGVSKGDLSGFRRNSTGWEQLETVCFKVRCEKWKT